jgi:uncharacterized membrane protein YgdD (TMEM256/DUF423 family)
VITLHQQGRLFITLGAINAGLAVALGAFGAHGLQDLLSEKALLTWHTAVDYHGFHALGLLLIGILSHWIPVAVRAGWWLLAGILLFSGSLYLLSLTGVSALGAITPLGGLCFLLGWALLARLALRKPED